MILQFCYPFDKVISRGLRIAAGAELGNSLQIFAKHIAMTARVSTLCGWASASSGRRWSCRGSSIGRPGRPWVRRNRIGGSLVSSSTRRRGVAEAALNGALGLIRGAGGGVVESMPEEVAGRKVSGSFLWNAEPGMFERAGFARVRNWASTCGWSGPRFSAGLPGLQRAEGSSRAGGRTSLARWREEGGQA